MKWYLVNPDDFLIQVLASKNNRKRVLNTQQDYSTMCMDLSHPVADSKFEALSRLTLKEETFFFKNDFFSMVFLEISQLFYIGYQNR